MNDRAGPERLSLRQAAPARSGYAIALWIALPLFLLGLAAAWLVVSDPCAPSTTARRRRTADVRAPHPRQYRHPPPGAGRGSEPITIAQVQVDDAYWTFVQDPPGDLARLATAWIHVPSRGPLARP